MSDPQEAATPSDPHSAEALAAYPPRMTYLFSGAVDHNSDRRDAFVAGHASRDAEVAELKAKIAEIRGLHWPKRGSAPRYAADDFEHEREPVAWEDYMICDYDKTPWPCKSAQILGSASSPVEGGN